jgi:hypothetical protein
MEKVYLGAGQQTGLKIMVFVEGTILKPKSWLTLYNHNSYIPIGNAVDKIKSWQQQGAIIIYCTSRRKKKHMNDMVSVLKKHDFVGAVLVARETKESYANIVETLLPDVLIEDDCKSIGGAWQMCITKVKPEIKEKIKSVVVQEFKGIDNLSDDINLL